MRERNCHMAWMTKFIPPNISELLERHLPDNAQWYEVRNGLSVAAYTIEDYDKALLNARHIIKTFPTAAVFYIWKQGGSMHEQRMF